VAAIVARNRCHLVPIILGPVTSIPLYRNTCRHRLFSTILTIRLIQKIVQVQFILFAIYSYCCMYFKLELSVYIFAIIF
jgi:hypothetical protein